MFSTLNKSVSDVNITNPLLKAREGRIDIPIHKPYIVDKLLIEHFLIPTLS